MTVRVARFEQSPGLAWADAEALYYVASGDRPLYYGPDEATARSIADWHGLTYGWTPTVQCTRLKKETL